MQCLICEKDLQGEAADDLGHIVYDGGTLELTMGYGSRYDGYLDNGDFKSRLLSSTVIRTFICDDCFEKKIKLFEGWDKIVQRPQFKRKV